MSESTVPDDFVLPDNWWQTFDSIEILLKQFRQYVIGLLIAGTYDQKYLKTVYSGFLTWYRDQLFWNTAGHVIDELATALASPKFDVIIRRWLDNFDVDGPPAGPLHYPKIQMKSWTSVGVDYGVIAVEGLDAISLIESKQTSIWHLDTWQPANSVPDGHFAIGYPLEWTRFESKQLPNGKFANNMQADMACVPLQIVDRPIDTRGYDFWDDPDAFYGKILPVLGRPDLELVDLKGMSGGPVFSIQSFPDRQFMYRLVGSQRTWDPNIRTIRAEPTERIMKLLDEWIDSGFEMQEP
jgi:hypothetical protein